MPYQQILETLGFMLDCNKYRIDFVGTIGTDFEIGNNFESMVADNYELAKFGA